VKPRVNLLGLINVNAYWLGLSFMWNSLHVLVMPAVLLNFVPDERKNTVLGLLTFMGLIVAMIVQPVSGALSDRFSTRIGRRRPWIAVGTLFDLLCLSGLAVAGGLPLLGVAYIGLQFTSNVAHGPAQGLMHDRVPLEQMGLASGVKNVFDMAGMVISSLLIGRLLTTENLAPTMATIAGFLLLSAAFTLFGVRESTPIGSGANQDTESDIQISSVDPRVKRDYGFLILARLLFLIGVYGVQTFSQYYIRDVLDVADPVKLTGDLLATIVLTLIGFSIVAGYLCDRLGRKPLHTVAAILIGVGCVLMTTADSPRSILIFGSVIGAGIGLFISANWALANDLAPAGQAGKFLGLTNIATAGAAAISRLAGPGIDALNAFRPGSYFGYDGLFLGTAFFALLSLIVLTRVPERITQGGT
jgi:MFS family permease